MPHDESAKTEKSGSSFKNWVALVILALVAYQVYNGVAMKKVGLFGMYIDFADKGSDSVKAEASREFVLGRWQVEQASGQESGSTVFEYHEDGTFTGTVTNFNGSNGVKSSVSGRWEMQRLSSDTFRMRITAPNYAYEGTFKVFDQDHLHNIDNNFMAVRIR
jgi:hypothetical protein